MLRYADAGRSSMSLKAKVAGGWWMIPLFTIASFAAGMDIRLVDAVKTGDRQAVRALLNANADVNAAGEDGATALAWAAHRGDLEAADILINAGADVNVANDYGVTPLSLACTNGHAELVERLLKAGANPNAAQPTGETPLMTCARAGSVDAVKSLLDHGADVNAKEAKGQTALMWAVAERHSEVVRTLVAHGAHVDARSSIETLDTPVRAPTYFPDVHFPTTTGGFTPLLFAAQQGDVESARILLEAGADINGATAEDGSALVVATASGHEKLAIFLLEKGADPNAKDGYGITALHWALQEGIHALSGAGASPTDGYWWHPNRPELVKALLAHGANPNARIEKDFAPYDFAPVGRTIGNNLPQISLVGVTPFLLATAVGDVSLMGVLVEGRADPRLATAQNTTPLMVAAGLGRERQRGYGGGEAEPASGQKNYLEAAKLVMALGGADVNAAEQHGGRTAIHAATYMGSLELIRLLAENGVNLEAKDKYGQTPMTMALGDPEGLAFRPLPGAGVDYTFRGVGTGGIGAATKKVVELLLELGATPFTGKYRDRSGE
jgi:ankyrin repeat protein